MLKSGSEVSEMQTFKFEGLTQHRTAPDAVLLMQPSRSWGLGQILVLTTPGNRYVIFGINGTGD